MTTCKECLYLREIGSTFVACTPCQEKAWQEALALFIGETDCE